MYDKTSPLTSVNETREELFCRKSRSIDRIPPTQDAYSAGTVPSWNLDYLYANAASNSLTTGIFMDQGFNIRAMDPSVDYNPRSFQSM